MRILERPPVEPPQPKEPGFWASLRVPVGTVVEHGGHVWRREWIGAGGDSMKQWVYVSTYSQWRHSLPAPEGGAGDSKAARR